MTDSQKTNKFNWKLFMFLVVTVLIIQVGYYFFVQSNVIGLDKQGQFGDMFGALTALFSGLAFAGMITAIVLQTKELSYQREELELTRTVLSDSAASQADLVSKQLLSAQIQGLGSLLESHLKSAENNEMKNTENANRLYEKAAHYTVMLEELLSDSGLDVKNQ